MKKEKIYAEKKRRTAGYWIALVLLGIGSVAMLFPNVWMILSSFKTQGELFTAPPSFLPRNWYFDNYPSVFAQMPFASYYLNSVWTSALNTAVGLLTSSIVGYVFAKYHFKFRDAIFLVVLACMMIPYETLMPTVYRIMVKFGWTNSYKVLTVPYFCNIFGIFLMRQFFMDLPNDYLEAAEIDGCSQLRTWWSVAMPMARATIAALLIFLFMASYNSFLWPLISVDSRKYFTLPIGISTMIWDRGNQYAMLMAAAAMVIIPVCILFACMQKQFIEGMTAGGIKG